MNQDKKDQERDRAKYEFDLSQNCPAREGKLKLKEEEKTERKRNEEKLREKKRGKRRRKKGSEEEKIMKSKFDLMFNRADRESASDTEKNLGCL